MGIRSTDTPMDANVKLDRDEGKSVHAKSKTAALECCLILRYLKGGSRERREHIRQGIAIQDLAMRKKIRATGSKENTSFRQSTQANMFDPI
ncbi:hypothetical protein CsSME_00006303 [Camellia sinensis var. sinensis]